MSAGPSIHLYNPHNNGLVMRGYAVYCGHCNGYHRRKRSSTLAAHSPQGYDGYRAHDYHKPGSIAWGVLVKEPEHEADFSKTCGPELLINDAFISEDLFWQLELTPGHACRDGRLNKHIDFGPLYVKYHDI